MNCPKSQSYLVMELEFESRSVCIDLKLCLPLSIYHSAYTGFPGGSEGKESACNVGDLGSILGLGRPPRGGHGNPLQHSCLENPHEQRSLADCSSWGHKRSDTTERQDPAFSTRATGTITVMVVMVMVVIRFNFTIASKARSQHW